MSAYLVDLREPDDRLCLYFVPCTVLNVYGGGMALVRVCPMEGPGKTTMEFDGYDVDEGEKCEEHYEFLRHAALANHRLCEEVQYNRER